MQNYLLIYKGGSMPETDEEVQKEMAAWGAWLEGLGGAVVDAGNPVGKSMTINPDKSIEQNGGAEPATGYGILKGEDDADIAEKAKACPHLNSGGTIEVAPIIELEM